MSKELSPKEALKNLTEYLTGSMRDCSAEIVSLKSALDRLEELETKTIPNMKDHFDSCNEERIIVRNQRARLYKKLKRLEELEKVLSFIKEHVLLDGSILRADFQWDLDIEENGELLKEYFK